MCKVFGQSEFERIQYHNGAVFVGPPCTPHICYDMETVVAGRLWRAAAWEGGAGRHPHGADLCHPRGS